MVQVETVRSRADRRHPLATVVLLVCGCVGNNCGTEPDCVPPPCPLPTAIVMNVTSVTGGPIASLIMTASGEVTGSGSCSVENAATVCRLHGTPGLYNIRLTAPGFQEKALSVTVAGKTPPCACAIIQVQQLSISLTPS